MQSCHCSSFMLPVFSVKGRSKMMKGWRETQRNDRDLGKDKRKDAEKKNYYLFNQIHGKNFAERNENLVAKQRECIVNLLLPCRLATV